MGKLSWKFLEEVSPGREQLEGTSCTAQFFHCSMNGCMNENSLNWVIDEK